MQILLDEIGKNIKLPKRLQTMRNYLETTLYDIHYSSKLEASNRRIKKYKNKHTDGYCFVIGNGPSLNKTNMDLLKKQICICVNAFYLGLDNFKIPTNYWIITDGILFEKHYKNLLQLNTELFITGQASRRLLENREKYMKDARIEPNIIQRLNSKQNGKQFSTDLTEGIYGGGGVMKLALQLAYHLGFKEIYLIGVDCGQSGNNHHFYKSNEQNKKTTEEYYNLIFKQFEECKKIFEQNGRKIYNATIGGNLEVFERKKLEDII